jgi:hypothetical protein
MDSKTAIEVIYSLEEKIDFLISKMEIVEKNVTNLNNKVYVLNSKINNSGISAPTHNNDYTSHGSDVIVGQSQGNPSAVAPGQEDTTFVSGKVKVYGNILNQEKKPLSEVYVRVFNSQSKVIKEASTDASGYWECRLPPGRFGVEYTHKKFKPINRNITVPSDVSSFEVK